MPVPWNKSAYQYADELEEQIGRLREEIKELKKKPAPQPDNELLMAAVRALISDIEAMQPDMREPDWFSSFSEFETRFDADRGIEVVSIQWPNLAISLAEVKKLLEPKTIEHQEALPK
ncbi:MAG: hypothetical protein EOQ44_25155 [Mesorhizobium sp.]|uniref:hypothetical protein n=1 Tax=Mesorhizobium sp. TaxID=1871066 RepID=UPI000FE9D2E1|nr:hypothetical protein [Mesorhizobium sp.]RWB40434.1 MAG: hypothetical protein EOQ44_25155 [Mesorhizobium sp.]